MDTGSQDVTALLQGIWSEVKNTHQSLTRRFEGVESRLDGIDGRLDGIDSRLDHMDARFDHVDARLEHHGSRLDLVEATLLELSRQQTTLTRYVKAVVDRHDAAIELLDARVTRLEDA